MDLFRKVPWNNSHLCCLEIGGSVPRSAGRGSLIHSRTVQGAPAVQFRRVGLANRSQQRRHDLAETSRPQPLFESTGGTWRTPGEVLSCASLKEVNIRPTSIAQLAVPTSQSLSPSLHLSPIYTLQTSCVTHVPCFSTCNQSVHGVPTNAAQLHSARQTNTCVLSAKNPSPLVLSHVHFSRISSLNCLLQ